MLDDHSDAGVVHSVVNMYVEEVGMELTADNQDIWAGDDGGDDDAVDVNNAWADSGGEGKRKGPASDYSSDEDYVHPLDEDSSVEDEEAAELRKYAHDIKRKNRASKLGIHGSQVREIRIQDLVDEVPNLDEPSSPYMDSK
jgi:hypothetical protein